MSTQNRKRSTNKDVARLAGVSPAVVSRIVNNDPGLRVSDRTRQQVLRIIEELGYVPNAHARLMRSSRTSILALILHDTSNPVYAEIVKGAQSAAIRHQMTLILAEASELEDNGSNLFRLVKGDGVDGLLLQGSGTALDKSIEDIARYNIPMALLQSGMSSGATLVSLQDCEAAAVATKHLIGCGHRDIGFLGVNPDLIFSEKRKSGWRNAMIETGLYGPSLYSDNAGNNLAGGLAASNRFAALSTRPTGVVVANTAAAIGFTSGLSRLGIAVPRDVSVVGIHDIEMADYVSPRITTVALPLQKLGYTAASLVCDSTEIHGNAVIIDDPPPRLVVRESTAAPRS